MIISLGGATDVTTTALIQQNVTEVTILSIMDNPSARRIVATLAVNDVITTLELWSGVDYDAIGDWKTVVDARINALL